MYKTVTSGLKGICMSMRQFLVFEVGMGVPHMHKTAPTGQKGNCMSVPLLQKQKDRGIQDIARPGLLKVIFMHGVYVPPLCRCPRRPEKGGHNRQL